MHFAHLERKQMITQSASEIAFLLHFVSEGQLMMSSWEMEFVLYQQA